MPQHSVSVLQCAAVCCNVLQYVVVRLAILLIRCVAVCCQRVAVCSSVLQFVILLITFLLLPNEPLITCLLLPTNLIRNTPDDMSPTMTLAIWHVYQMRCLLLPNEMSPHQMTCLLLPYEYCQTRPHDMSCVHDMSIGDMSSDEFGNMTCVSDEMSPKAQRHYNTDMTSHVYWRHVICVYHMTCLQRHCVVVSL